MSKRVAVVTGANKGIGYAIVRGLAPLFDGIVYLTDLFVARNEELGHQAVKKLEDEDKIKVQYHQLAIDDQQSIDRFAKFIKEKHGGLDLLINNAAIAIMTKDPADLLKDTRQQIKVNYTSTLNLCNALFPLLRPHARVVNVASSLGKLKFIADKQMYNSLLRDDLTVQDIDSFINQYEKAMEKGEQLSILNNQYGAYSFSKVMLIGLTRIQQKNFDKDTSRPDIVINAVCPGYVATDLNNNSGTLTTTEGAETPIHVALLPPNYTGPKGVFWSKKQIVDWTDPN